MLNKIVIAEVLCIPKEKGGGQIAPTGGKYYSIIHFENMYEVNCDWSAEVLCTEFDKSQMTRK